MADRAPDTPALDLSAAIDDLAATATQGGERHEPSPAVAERLGYRNRDSESVSGGGGRHSSDSNFASRSS